jgi:hypothetical protein
MLVLNGKSSIMKVSMFYIWSWRSLKDYTVK